MQETRKCLISIPGGVPNDIRDYPVNQAPRSERLPAGECPGSIDHGWSRMRGIRLRNTNEAFLNNDTKVGSTTGSIASPPALTTVHELTSSHPSQLVQLSEVGCSLTATRQTHANLDKVFGQGHAGHPIAILDRVGFDANHIYKDGVHALATDVFVSRR